MMEKTALGMIETVGLVAAIEGADAGLKAADVRLMGRDYVRGGLIMIRFAGDVAAVQAAVDAGAAAAGRVGRVLSCHVIPRALPEVFQMLTGPEPRGPAGGCASCGGCQGGKNACGRPPRAEPSRTDYARWKVVDLRRRARSLKDFPLSPNDIRYANKQTLLKALAQWEDRP